MNEVEKLYRNCGIENYRLENFSGFVPDGYIIIDDENREGYVKEIVRDFTAEKQLELIKWLANRIFPIHIGKFKGKYYFGDANFNSNENHFEEALATRVNDLWNILTDAECKQIKNILESEVRE